MSLCGRSKDVDRVRRPWSPEEDEVLQQLVQNHGARNWSLISKSIPGRSGNSCQYRWYNHLSPETKCHPFTPKDDETIRKAQSRFGNRFDTIALLLPHHTEVAIRNHWNSTLKGTCVPPVDDLGTDMDQMSNEVRPPAVASPSPVSVPPVSDLSESSHESNPIGALSSSQPSTSLVFQPVTRPGDVVLPVPLTSTPPVRPPSDNFDDISSSLNHSLSLPGFDKSDEVPPPAVASPSPALAVRRMVQEDAKNGKLRTEDILFIFQHYSCSNIGLTNQPPHQPPSGSLYIFNTTETPDFLNDGHSWKIKSANGNIHTMHTLSYQGRRLRMSFASGAENPHFYRRTYEKVVENNRVCSPIVLVHYLDETPKHQ